MNKDGIALTVARHSVPRLAWLRTLWWRLIRRGINQDALQVASIDVKPPHENDKHLEIYKKP